jgi:hypothetical protein
MSSVFDEEALRSQILGSPVREASFQTSVKEKMRQVNSLKYNWFLGYLRFRVSYMNDDVNFNNLLIRFFSSSRTYSPRGTRLQWLRTRS